MSDLATWQRIRRYAVPERMIAECTAARERGDWRAACAAADVAVGFDSPAGVEDLVAGFAPDLLRWHLPRALGGYTTLATDASYVLYGTSPVTAGTKVLVVHAPVSVLGSQQLRLEIAAYGSLNATRVIRLAPHLWDARRAGELRAVVGGPTSPHTPLGSGVPAWAEAGVEATVDDEGSTPFDLARLAWLDPFLLAAEARRVAALFGSPSWAIWFDYNNLAKVDVEGGAVRLTAISLDWRSRRREDHNQLPQLSAALLRPSADLDLVRSGRTRVTELHPLVREALFPAAAAPAAAPAPAEPPIRVRCRGVWHEIEHAHGRLVLREHTAAEEQRERALLAFGGTVSGCFAAAQAWSGKPGRLPKRLRAIREDLWQRIIHGGTRTVLEMLDAGLDPALRNGRGHTLMHMVRSFDHTRLLPRLLAEGADINARDRQGSTPLYLAVTQDWPAGLIRAMVDAGADPRVPNQDDMSVLEYLDEMLEYMEHRGEDFHAVATYIQERAA
ncbi:hypothetical protein Ade02nite_58840 [Paractinoplanes deccanensis]|uniref:Ankyrin repeat domain-containing protein n=1 Tax=Paractinoplanes deccanensis TaxID=113561 RepID=A0ABQ3YB40_9ACTN|nr:ankyrin repeat domain-containing protein [Actinoplanes deccanensis]GID77243.1 hypothetical protein Ade02nite_58840 [Actinoplanes deccanensis]